MGDRSTIRDDEYDVDFGYSILSSTILERLIIVSDTREFAKKKWDDAVLAVKQTQESSGMSTLTLHLCYTAY